MAAKKSVVNVALDPEHLAVSSDPSLRLDRVASNQPAVELSVRSGPGAIRAVLIRLAEVAPFRLRSIRSKADEIRERELRLIEIRAIDDRIEIMTPNSSLSRRLSRTITVAMATVVIGGCALYLFSQVTTAIASLMLLPPLVRYCGFAILMGLISTIGYAVLRVAFVFSSLETSEKLRLTHLTPLRERSDLRAVARRYDDAARVRLASYLKSYPVKRLSSTANGWQVEPNILDAMRVARTELVAENAPAAPADWVSKYAREFQTQVDAIAAERINYYSKRVLLVTFASPNALIDSIMSAYCAFMMVSDLCQTYNLRTGRTGTAIVLGRVFFNAYLAGQLSDLESAGSAAIEDMLKQSGVHLGSIAVDSAVAHLAGKVTMRATSSALNGLMLRRLGKYTVGLLQPVQSK